jgi:uncharacterized protein RhaS with RHS repeats
MSEDPAHFRGGINLYGYVAGNPVRYTDPLGLEVKWDCSYTFASVNYQAGPGVGELRAECTSKCVNRIRVRASVYAVPVGVSGGPLIGGVAKSTIELRDPTMTPDALNLTGPANYSSFGFATPIDGWSASAMRLGSATGWSAGWGTYGLDMGVDGYGGVATLMASSKEQCCE